ncbi:MAG: hypothetical protein AAF265_11945 [Pseudomonadota bacterium]
MRNCIFIVVFLSWSAMCVSADESLRNVTVVTDEGFVDFTLPLAGVGQSSGDKWLFKIRGLFGDEELGFDVQLGSTWEQEEIHNGEITLHWGSAVILRSGVESDRFCDLIRTSYGNESVGTKMREALDVMAVALGTDPAQMRQSPVKMKMFIEPADDEGYAEFYLNVDLPSRVVQFNEKDTEYRVNLLKALCT